MTQPEPLRPRAERCPEPECTDEQQCWRCDYEESQHAAAQPTGRPTASTITDTELDQLYAERDMLGREADRLRKDWVEQRTRAERAEAERDQARDAIRSALPDLRRAVDCLDATCRYHGDRLDPDEYGRRYRAEACCDTGVEPRRAREARQTLDRLSAALDEHQEQT